MALNEPPLGTTDLKLWRLRVSDGGRHVWHYLSEQEASTWPQSIEDKYWLGLDVKLPKLAPARNASDAARIGLEFYKHLQSNDGHFAGEYGGPMFLLPGLIIGMYATKTPIPEPWRIEIARYLWNRRSPSDGGWGM
ncbi:Sad1-interacting factor 3 [Malassezia yamatoensis]|uniref:Sad1-interacting factor 3 n=1 Tax=Malassezia yamatoensis TaxID=253288 RepID=A0AAJ5YSL4_9BASI|nr:Sad1-interacting factor 3 [Malassezia yamatoensis]